MEDVLDLYARPHDPKRPVVCFDEQPRQLIAEVRTPVPMGPGRPQRVDYEYRRAGTANLFLAFEPLAGWRHVEVTAQRTAGDFAQQMKALVEVHYPEAEVIAVVLDNLSTHSPAALYRTFRPEEALRLLKRLEFHYTPKHGSWLNMAEIEFSALGRQCLARRVAQHATLRRHVAQWEDRRNATQAKVTWHLTTNHTNSG
jgi:hypothetical protein